MIAALYVETDGCYFGVPGVDPWDADRFAYDAMMEAKVAAYIGDGYAILRDRRGGEAKPLTLSDFRSEVLADPGFRFEYDEGESGCGCASEYAADDFDAVRQA